MFSWTSNNWNSFSLSEMLAFRLLALVRFLFGLFFFFFNLLPINGEKNELYFSEAKKKKGPCHTMPRPQHCVSEHNLQPLADHVAQSHKSGFLFYFPFFPFFAGFIIDHKAPTTSAAPSLS